MGTVVVGSEERFLCFAAFSPLPEDFLPFLETAAVVVVAVAVVIDGVGKMAVGAFDRGGGGGIEGVGCGGFIGDGGVHVDLPLLSKISFIPCCFSTALSGDIFIGGRTTSPVG